MHGNAMCCERHHNYTCRGHYNYSEFVLHNADNIRLHVIERGNVILKKNMSAYYFLPAPNEKMKKMLLKTMEESRALISKVRFMLLVDVAADSSYIFRVLYITHLQSFHAGLFCSSETSAGQCVRHHGGGEGSLRPAQGCSHDCLPHGSAAPRPNQDGV